MDWFNKASGNIFFHLPEGVISEIRGLEEVSKVLGVYQTYLQNIQVGKETKQMVDKGDRLGPILIMGEDRTELQDVINRVTNTLYIHVETAEGIKGIIW